jgi:streptomycin 6-kinase
MPDIAEATERWHLASVTPIADTPGSLVYRARQPDGHTVVAKILKPRGMGEITGMDYLAWRDGHGAVRLLARDANACLLEDAGARTLEDVRQSDGEAIATEIFAGLLRQLQAPTRRLFPMGLVPLSQHFVALLSQRTNVPPVQEANIGWAADVARGLLSRQTNVMPLHGDLHHENILSDGSGQWRAIDPHGLIGDPVYDAANFFGNPLGRPDVTCDEARIRLLAGCLAPALGCSENKVLRYAAAHAGLSACWSMDDPVSEDDRCDAEHRLMFLATVRAMIG